MTNNAESFRRWLGMLFLTASFAMMIWGQIVLQPHLSGVVFNLYWLVCFGLSIAAVAIGILDVRDVLRELKAERAALLRSAMRDISRPEKRVGRTLAEKQGQ